MDGDISEVYKKNFSFLEVNFGYIAVMEHNKGEAVIHYAKERSDFA